MGDEFQWRQLGSVANIVLMQAKTQAIRNGSLSKAAPQVKPAVRALASSVEKEASFRASTKRAIGFLDDAAPAVPMKQAQLELPLGIDKSVAREPSIRRSARNSRMM